MLGNLNIKEFPNFTVKLKDTKNLTMEELGNYIKYYDCPNCFAELTIRLWKEFKYQATSIVGNKSDVAYDLFIDFMYTEIRRKVYQWSDDKKSGKFMGWCKRALYTNFLSSQRLQHFKQNKNTVSLSNIGEFTNNSEVEFKAGIFENPKDELYENSLNLKSEFEILMNSKIEILDEIDRIILNSIVVQKLSVNDVSENLKLQTKEVTQRFNKIKKSLKKCLESEYKKII
jgi:DNA-directed RNA polymerase specialized sigma24 family protein